MRDTDRADELTPFRLPSLGSDMDNGVST